MKLSTLIDYYQSKQKDTKSKNTTGIILDVCYANKDKNTNTRKRGK